MRIVFINILVILVSGCSGQCYVSEKEQFREVPVDLDFQNHEYYKTYIPKGLYAKAFCASGFEGYTVVEFNIDASGNTTDYRVIESDALKEFEEVSILRVAGMNYKPRTIGGKYLAGC